VEKYKLQLSKLCVKIHMSVTEKTVTFYDQLRRHNYVTPTSYLELIKIYTTMLLEQRTVVETKLQR
jgi:dynein heavy chain